MIGDFNLEFWPIVYLKLNDKEINENSFEEYKKYYLNLLLRCKKNNEKMVLICNLNSGRMLPLDYVMKQAQFNKEIHKFNKDYIETVCILCKEKSFKNVLNLYFTVAKPANPYKLSRSFEKINSYLKDKFNINFDVSIFENQNESIEISEEEEALIEENPFVIEKK
jgi:hypothetical protein